MEEINLKKLIVGALSCSLLLLAGCRNNLVEPKHKSSAADYAIIQSSHKQSHKKVEKEKPKNKDDKNLLTNSEKYEITAKLPKDKKQEDVYTIIIKANKATGKNKTIEVKVAS